MRIEALPGDGTVVSLPGAAAWFGSGVPAKVRRALLELLDDARDGAQAEEMAGRVLRIGPVGRLALLWQTGSFVGVVIAGEVILRDEHFVRSRGESSEDLLHAEIVIEQTLEVASAATEARAQGIGFLDGVESVAGGGIRLHAARASVGGASARLSARAAVPHLARVPADGPLVDGVECIRGHFNRPGVRYCVICGIAMRQGAGRARGRRPQLGVLVAGGASMPVYGDVLIGSAPETDPDVREGRVSGLGLPGGPAVADVHVRLIVREWTVEVHDLGAGGVRVLDPGSGLWADADPSHPVILKPGGIVEVGGATIEYRDRREHG